MSHFSSLHTSAIYLRWGFRLSWWVRRKWDWMRGEPMWSKAKVSIWKSLWRLFLSELVELIKDLALWFEIYRCEDQRCLDPSVCCDPNLDPSCNVIRDCCIPIIEAGRQFYKLGIEKRKSQDLEFLHSTVTVIIGTFYETALLSKKAATICNF